LKIKEFGGSGKIVAGKNLIAWVFFRQKMPERRAREPQVAIAIALTFR
jgi:hypothetical protein